VVEGGEKWMEGRSERRGPGEVEGALQWKTVRNGREEEYKKEEGSGRRGVVDGAGEVK
jgi:hypothetical protein